MTAAPTLRNRLAAIRDQLLARLEQRTDRSDIAMLADILIVIDHLRLDAAGGRREDGRGASNAFGAGPAPDTGGIFVPAFSGPLYAGSAADTREGKKPARHQRV